ncbi:orexin receptor type 1-like [Octopus sinensis]|uniref:Orexin receptor type 1-like n=1 Tax=Octopus sinensis TaxID=2607531 RepID=A0A6P7T4D9_9MOLL|nr:orexin receptor type 1-like [Octopus sinensis]XP_036364763.1 orexin receptor type 1-like [Octopus sinensis]
MEEIPYEYLTIQNNSRILEELNSAKSIELLPTILAVILMASVGAVGNILVWYIYAMKLEKTATNFFIASLGLADFFTCSIGIPIETFILCHSLAFYSDVACKVMRYITGVTITTAAVIVLLIAVDRYFRVCRPRTWQFTRRSAVHTVGVVFAIVVTGTSPGVFIFGCHKVSTSVDLVGYECFISEEYISTIFPTVYFVSISVIYFAAAITLSSIYFMVGLRVRRHERTWRLRESRSSRHDINHSAMLSCDRRARNLLAPQTVRRSSIHLFRTTLVLLMITIIWIISYWPNLILVNYAISKPDIKANMGVPGLNSYNMAVRSYFINNAINPFIYGFFNRGFRSQVLKIWKGISKCFHKTPVPFSVGWQ